MIERITNIILGTLDVRKLNKSCNFPDCTRKIDSEVSIYEYTTSRKIGFATLYLCREHLHVANELLKRIKEEVPNKIIQSRIGKVAQPGRAHG